jgi:photosystem II stability/assembly factor-like uncharacterized protein
MALGLVLPGTGLADELEAVAAPLAPKRLLLGGSQADGRMVVVGQYGHVLVSDDGGHEWQQARVPSRVTLTDVFMVNQDRGWAVGHDATIFATRDGGRTWQLQYEDPDFDAPLLSVWFRNEDYGLAVGAYGLMLMTEDGGENWVEHPVNDEDDFHLNDLVSAGSGVLYMAAEAGMLYRSADDGLSWEELESPYEGSFFGILPLPGDSLLAFGLRGHLFRSDDAGGTWEELDSGTEGIIMSGRRLGSDRVVLVGLTGSILFSDDDGASFRLYGQSDREALLEVLEGDQDSLITVGEFGVRRKRLDDIQPGAAS